MITNCKFNLDVVDLSWRPVILEALKKVDSDYLEKLYQSDDWLPGHDAIFNSFSIPIHKVSTVLLGESPYPRKKSANGYAFWDAAVTNIWSEKGLSREVNRATSLRNIIKMLLVAEGILTDQVSQPHIAACNKNGFIETNQELFLNLLNKGFLLLNASLVLQDAPVKQDSKNWQPFVQHVLHSLIQFNPNVTFLLLGKHACELENLLPHDYSKKIIAEHPYNLSFIYNPKILDFFRPLHLLCRSQS